MARRLSGKAVKLTVAVILVPLVIVGVYLGIKKSIERDRAESHVRPVPSPSASQVYNVDLPGEDGFWEYHKSIGYKGSKESALDAGYTTCTMIRLIGSTATYERLRVQADRKEDVDRLMFASVRYLCPDLTGK